MMNRMKQHGDRVSFRTFSVLLSTILLSFGVCVEARPTWTGSHQPIIALAGDDVTLPCALEPPRNADSETVEWTRDGLSPKFVHFHKNRKPELQQQHPSYKGRTALFVDKLKNGNLSLKLLSVKISDAGKYSCKNGSGQEIAAIQLTVGAVSNVFIKLLPSTVSINGTNTTMVLQCESKGWYPQPEVSWLDGEGHILSVGPTETVRGPDGLYNVTRNVTVEYRINTNFTCKIQQMSINQTRQATLYFRDRKMSYAWLWIIIVVVFVTGVILTTLKFK